MSRSIENRHDDDTRRHILQAAFEAFGEYGYAQTTVRAIAERAQVAPGSIYTYFDDKEALFRSTVQDGWRSFHEEVQDVLGRDGNLQRNLIDIVDRGFDLLHRMSPLLRGMFSEANRMDLVHDNIEEICDTFEPLLSDLLADPPNHDRERCRDFVRFHIRILVSGILLRVAVTPPEHLDGELDVVKRNVMYGFVTRSARAAPEAASTRPETPGAVGTAGCTP